jgi:type I restriction enzyme, S subunit
MRRVLPMGWVEVSLEEVARVQTGLAKNSEKTPARPVTLPYLRVANVQDGNLDLSEVKMIVADEADVPRYSLADGDVLLTEGGDFDKLGRGCVWRSPIPQCLHQNHVFAVRPDQARVLPDYLAAYCGSAEGKRYFLSCSKQTTNLASINSSQLKSMPLPLPPITEQQRIVAVACEATSFRCSAPIAS